LGALSSSPPYVGGAPHPFNSGLPFPPPLTKGAPPVDGVFLPSLSSFALLPLPLSFQPPLSFLLPPLPQSHECTTPKSFGGCSPPPEIFSFAVPFPSGSHSFITLNYLPFPSVQKLVVPVVRRTSPRRRRLPATGFSFLPPRMGVRSIPPYLFPKRGAFISQESRFSLLASALFPPFGALLSKHSCNPLFPSFRPFKLSPSFSAFRPLCYQSLPSFLLCVVPKSPWVLY